MKFVPVSSFEVWCCLIVSITMANTIEEISAPVHTELVCGWDTLKAECGLGEVIHFLRANYGRTSLLHCNAGNIPWNVNCDFPESNEIMKGRCDGKRSCEVLATNSVFGDPCVGTHKYLEMDFQCRPVDATKEEYSPPVSDTVFVFATFLALIALFGFIVSCKSRLKRGE